MSELLTLPLFCAHCGKPMSVEIERRSEEFLLATTQLWDCPECQTRNYLKFDGAILGVSPGHDHPDLPKP